MCVRGKLSDWFVQENDTYDYLALWYWEETETQMEKPLDVTDQKSHEMCSDLRNIPSPSEFFSNFCTNPSCIDKGTEF